MTNIDSGQFHQWYVKAVDDDVDVWVNVNQGGTWSHPIDSTGNGANVLGDIGSGGVGLAGNALAGGGSVVCDYLRVGVDGNADHNLGDANEAVIDDSFSSLQINLGYDAGGNLTDDGVYQYVYDAWNRLVQVKRKGGSQPVVATYRYDGLGHRVYKKVENCGDMNREDYFYYNQKWQLLEIDNADNVARQQFVWGTNYIDEAICMDVDTGTDGNCTDGSSRHFFYMQDANWNVVGVREGTTIVERYEYDPYGTVRIYRGSASPSAAEQRTVTGQSLTWLNPDLPGNPVMYAGYLYDNETGLHHVRHRMLGRDRWMQRDPKGYADGANCYDYVRSNPSNRRDPKGLKTVCVDPDPYVCGDEYCCEDELEFKGHGLFATCKCSGCWSGSIKFGNCVPDGMENGIGSDKLLVPADVAKACDSLCDGATLTLIACGVGKNEAYMRSLAAACPKIKKVCGYTAACRCIPWTDITIPLPWNWKCLDVNGGSDPKE